MKPPKNADRKQGTAEYTENTDRRLGEPPLVPPKLREERSGNLPKTPTGG
jgi:hypothetical protein